MMTLYGFFNAPKVAWLDNDFQSPHFVDIAAQRGERRNDH